MAEEASRDPAAQFRALIDQNPDLASKVSVEAPRQGTWFTRGRSNRPRDCAIDLGPLGALFHLITHPESLLDFGLPAESKPPVDPRLKEFGERQAERMFPPPGDPRR